MSRFGKLEFGERSDEQSRGKGLVRDGEQALALARAAFRRGDFEQALRHYARVLQFSPKDPEAWAGQVRMLIELGDYAEANRWADKALESMPREPEVLAAKAVALARLGDLQAALAFSDAALGEEEQAPYVWLARGDVLLAREERRAGYCFEKALAAAPGEWLWPWLASRVHCVYRKFSLALKLISQALALDAAQAVVWLQLGRCQQALGLAAAAQNSYEQARQLDPGCSEAAAALAELSEFGILDRCWGWLRRRRSS